MSSSTNRLTAQDVPFYMREMLELDSPDVDENHESTSLPSLRGSVIAKVTRHKNTTESQKRVAEPKIQTNAEHTACLSTAIATPPRPSKEAPSVQCSGCHCLRPITDFITNHTIYKSCTNCRTKSASFYLEHKDDINANKYSSIDVFQCGCGSRVKMYCKRQHMKSERHKNWEMLSRSESRVQSTEREGPRSKLPDLSAA